MSTLPGLIRSISSGKGGIFASAYLELAKRITELFDYRFERLSYEDNRVRESAPPEGMYTKDFNIKLKRYGERAAKEADHWLDDIDQLLRISERYNLIETKYLRPTRENLVKGMELMYRGYWQKAIDTFKKKVFTPLNKFGKYLNPLPSYEQEAGNLGKKKEKRQESNFARVAQMIAVIGFFAIFLYSMSPSTTGASIAFSGFNLYLIAIFTFITIIALYFVYKM